MLENDVSFVCAKRVLLRILMDYNLKLLLSLTLASFSRLSGHSPVSRRKSYGY